MWNTRRLRKVGGSALLALPPNMLRQLGVAAGDDIIMVAVDGGVLLTRYTRRMEQAADAAEKFHRKFPHGVRRLARPASERI